MNRSGDESSDASPSSKARAELGDDDLAIAIAAGHEPALRQLIARYDRLVRYTIFRQAPDRCQSDPHWMDGVASEVWTGMVRAFRRDRYAAPASLRAYIVGIARNQSITALRKATTLKETPTLDLAAAAGESDPAALDPAEVAEKLDTLEALSGCLELLSGDDRTLAEHLPAILDRRWREAAIALDLAESTLRSRWKRVLEQLRTCVEGKTGQNFAPDAPNRD